MNEKMNQPVVASLGHVTWANFWEAYARENNSVQNALQVTGIYIEPTVLAEIESSARNSGEPGSNEYKDHFMDAVAKLPPHQLSSQTSYQTAAGSINWPQYWQAYEVALASLPEVIKSEGERVMSFEATKIASAEIGIDIKNLEDNHRTIFMGSKSPEEYQQNFMKNIAQYIRTPQEAQAEKDKKRAFQVGELKKELVKMNNTDYKDIYDPKVKEMTMSFVGKNANDPLVVEFGNKYMEVVGLFQKMANHAEPNSVAKADFIAKLLLENNGQGLKAIAAFSVLKDAVNKKYNFLGQIPNTKNDPNIKTQNERRQFLEFALIKPFQWIYKYETHLSNLGNQGENVAGLVQQFRDIGQTANLHKDDVDKRIQFLDALDGLQVLKSGALTGELNKLKAEMRLLSASHESIVKSVEALIGLYVKELSGNAIEKDKAIAAKNISVLSGFRNEMDVSSSSDLESTASSDSELESSVSSAPPSPPVSPRAPVSEKIEKKDFYSQYNRVRAEYAKGNLDEAVKLFVALCEDIQKNHPDVKPGGVVSGDALQKVMIEILAKSNPGLADVAMAKKLVGHASQSGIEGANYYIPVMMQNEINKLVIRDVFKNNPDPFTLSTQNGPLKVRAAYKTMANFNASDITEAILAEPSLADAFLKRRHGTKITGINFREMLAHDPESIRRLMVSKDPVIVRAIETSQLLETSHLTEEARAELKGRAIPERLGDIEMYDYPPRIDADVHAEDIAYCIEQLCEIDNPLLSKLLVEKFEFAVKHGLDSHIPDARQIERFVNDINDAIKGGMKFKDYDEILNSFGDEPPSMNALFNLSSKDFLGKEFKAAPTLTTAPKVSDDNAPSLKH